MKKIIVLVAFLHSVNYLHSQETSPEAEIRNLEETERRAVLKNDTIMLGKIWDKDLIINSLFNRVLLTTSNSDGRPVIIPLSYSSFTRELEEVLVKGDIVICMGHEVFVVAGEDNNGGEGFKQRYTNIWMKQNGTWKLIARHINLICDGKDKEIKSHE